MLNPNTNTPVSTTVTSPIEIFEHATRCIWAAELIMELNELEDHPYWVSKVVKIILDSLEAHNPERQMRELAKEVCGCGKAESDTPANDSEPNA